MKITFSSRLLSVLAPVAAAALTVGALTACSSSQDGAAVAAASLFGSATGPATTAPDPESAEPPTSDHQATPLSSPAVTSSPHAGDSASSTPASEPESSAAQGTSDLPPPADTTAGGADPGAELPAGHPDCDDISYLELTFHLEATDPSDSYSWQLRLRGAEMGWAKLVSTTLGKYSTYDVEPDPDRDAEICRAVHPAAAAIGKNDQVRGPDTRRASVEVRDSNESSSGTMYLPPAAAEAFEDAVLDRTPAILLQYMQEDLDQWKKGTGDATSAGGTTAATTAERTTVPLTGEAAPTGDPRNSAEACARLQRGVITFANGTGDPATAYEWTLDFDARTAAMVMTVGPSDTGEDHQVDFDTGAVLAAELCGVLMDHAVAGEPTSTDGPQASVTLTITDGTGIRSDSTGILRPTQLQDDVVAVLPDGVWNELWQHYTAWTAAHGG